ncbi:iron uptake transporter deferrochelatase/peroxidase subunit [Kitasatospora sp. NPDC088783]|uniref:iron uptake transporter deferrochelatase/peroxidase subunit n=1 Tax=Kitasatospora sp. NPDC088783 TaxID=3364077 RepID=UPI00380BB09F
MSTAERPPAAAPERAAAPGAARGPSRRAVLGGAGAGLAVGAAGGAWGGRASAQAPAAGAGAAPGGARVPFHGARQGGIVEPAQARVEWAAFDLLSSTRRDGLAALLRGWSAAAARMAAGEPAAEGENQIALDAGPSSLTVTFGFGATLFDKAGLADRRPEALAALPAFPGDALDPARSDGDLWVQVGADDALVAVHALRVLVRLATGLAAPRWLMSGFARTPGATPHPMTGRNLMGQVDGTNNPRPQDEGFAATVFATGPDWMAGGSYAVLRRIRMLLEGWDTLPLERQERIVGRRKSDGAPLSGGPDAVERTPVDLAATHPDGTLAIAPDAHVRVAAAASNGGAAMLRRGFSFHDGLLPDGSPDAGLLFAAYQADPARGFVPVQQRLARGDGLSRYLRHEASALFAVPPGAPEGGYVGQPLLEG